MLKQLIVIFGLSSASFSYSCSENMVLYVPIVMKGGVYNEAPELSSKVHNSYAVHTLMACSRKNPPPLHSDGKLYISDHAAKDKKCIAEATAEAESNRTPNFEKIELDIKL